MNCDQIRSVSMVDLITFPEKTEIIKKLKLPTELEMREIILYL